MENTRKLDWDRFWRGEDTRVNKNRDTYWRRQVPRYLPREPFSTYHRGPAGGLGCFRTCESYHWSIPLMLRYFLTGGPEVMLEEVADSPKKLRSYLLSKLVEVCRQKPKDKRGPSLGDVALAGLSSVLFLFCLLNPDGPRSLWVRRGSGEGGADNRRKSTTPSKPRFLSARVLGKIQRNEQGQGQQGALGPPISICPPARRNGQIACEGVENSLAFEL